METMTDKKGKIQYTVLARDGRFALCSRAVRGKFRTEIQYAIGFVWPKADNSFWFEQREGISSTEAGARRHFADFVRAARGHGYVPPQDE